MNFCLGLALILIMYCYWPTGGEVLETRKAGEETSRRGNVRGKTSAVYRSG